MGPHGNVDLKGLARIVRSTYVALGQAKAVLEKVRAINRDVRAFTVSVKELQGEFDRAFAHIVERLDRIEQHLGLHQDTD